MHLLANTGTIDFKGPLLRLCLYAQVKIMERLRSYIGELEFPFDCTDGNQELQGDKRRGSMAIVESFRAPCRTRGNDT